MKAIILVSSIFYILGLKISNKFELIKKASPADTIISQTVQPRLNKKSIDFTTAEKETSAAETTHSNDGCATEDTL